MTNLSSVSVSPLVTDVQESLRCLLSPALTMPAILGYVIRFYDPLSQQYRLSSHLAELGHHPAAAVKRLEKKIEAMVCMPDWRAVPLSLQGGGAVTWLYPLALPGLSRENYLFAIADTQLSPSQTAPLQTLAQAIASHLTVWQQQHSWQAKTAELEAVLGSVEHQVRQSLGLVNLYLSLLDGQALDERGQTTTENLRQTVTEIADRMSTILGQPARPTPVLTWVDLHQFVRDRGRTFAPSLQAKSVTMRQPGDVAWLQTEPHQLGQVIDNLLCNAIAFSPPGGVIEWTWDAFDGEVLIQITDQGPGVPPAAMRAIFQSGYTQRPQGQGLGLAIAHKIVSEHGGRIWVNNLARGGAQFSVIFPQTQSPQSLPVPSSLPAQSPECDYSHAAC